MANPGRQTARMAVAAPTNADLIAEDTLSLGGISARKALLLVGAAALMLVSLVLLAPAFADLPEAWQRLKSGHVGWLTLALGFEILSFLGHIILFSAVAQAAGSRIGLWASTQINLAGHAATRLFASAGAGGIALTAWAMRRSGMERSDVASRMTTFLVLLYGVYMGALVVGGIGLYTGLLPGGGSFAITIVPAIFGGAVIAAVAAAQWVKPGEGRVRKVMAPVGSGVRDARRLLSTRNLGLLGALMWWGFDIAVLWACFHAFGEAPAFAVITVAYFVGMLANTLPLPGGVGGVDGGMVGALIAFGVEPEMALIAVLAYRGFAFWLPIVPGAIAYVGLRRTVARWEREDAGLEGAGGHDIHAVRSRAWKVSAASSTILSSRSVSRRWRSRCRAPRASLGPTTPSSSPST
jgi:uncharacterized membrane protein YbhN (UPF0104 family)